MEGGGSAEGGQGKDFLDFVEGRLVGNDEGILVILLRAVRV
jgi:hypothetical protein